MKNLLYFVMFIMFWSCSKDQSYLNSNFGKEVVGNSYLVIDQNQIPNVVIAEWEFFDFGEMKERVILNNSQHYATKRERSNWGLINKGYGRHEMTVRFWTETTLLGYREWDFDFSGRDIVLHDQNGQKYVAKNNQ